jgi:hypothetical protein
VDMLLDRKEIGASRKLFSGKTAYTTIETLFFARSERHVAEQVIVVDTAQQRRFELCLIQYRLPRLWYVKQSPSPYK